MKIDTDIPVPMPNPTGSNIDTIRQMEVGHSVIVDNARKTKGFCQSMRIAGHSPIYRKITMVDTQRTVSPEKVEDIGKYRVWKGEKINTTEKT